MHIKQKAVGPQHVVTHAHTHMNASKHNSYLPVIGVHEMHGRMHPNYWQITILLVVGPLFIIGLLYDDPTLPIAGKLPIKTLQLPTNVRTCMFVEMREKIYTS